MEKSFPRLGGKPGAPELIFSYITLFSERTFWLRHGGRPDDKFVFDRAHLLKKFFWKGYPGPVLVSLTL